MGKRDLLILLLAIAVAAAVAISIFAGSSLETGSWGLSFPQEVAPPIGNAGKDQLKAYDAAYIGDTSRIFPVEPFSYPASKVRYNTFLDVSPM